MFEQKNNNRNIFSIDARIYYEDTDSGGVVYHANYLKYMERARTELLRSIGFEQDQLIDDLQLLFAVRSAQVEYLRPARFNDILRITVATKKFGRAYVMFCHEIYKVNADESLELLIEATIKIVSINTVNFKPIRLPRQLMEKLDGH